MAAIGIAYLFCGAFTAPAIASYDRHGIEGYGLGSHYEHHTRYRARKHEPYKHQSRKVHRAIAPQARVKTIAARVVDHPKGCPRVAFCGCGVAVKVFGVARRSLWLAANWLRFPPARPAPGMVAARRHHVFYILKTVAPGLVLAYDPNSGRHQTRIHVRSLAGFRVVDPRRG